MDLKYSIKTEADLKALERATKATDDLGRSVEKTARNLGQINRESKDAAAETGRASRSWFSFGESIDKAGRKIANTVIGVGAMTKAFFALKSALGPTIEALTGSIDNLTQSFGKFLASSESVSMVSDVITGKINNIASAFDALTAARQKFDLSVTSGVVGIAGAEAAPAGLRQMFTEFGALEQAHESTLQRGLSGVDTETAREIQIAEARGPISPAQRSAIEERGRQRKRAMIDDADKARIERHRTFQAGLPRAEQFNEQIAAGAEAQSARAAFRDATAERANIESAISNIEQEQMAAIGLSSYPLAITLGIRRFRLKRKLPAAIERQRRAQAADMSAVGRLRAAEQASGFPGIETFGQAAGLQDLAQGLFAEAGSGMAGRQSAMAGTSIGLSGESAFSGIVTPLQQNAFIQEQMKDDLEKMNRNMAEIARLLQSGFPIQSEIIQALIENNRRLENRQREVRNNAQ